MLFQIRQNWQLVIKSRLQSRWDRIHKLNHFFRFLQRLFNKIPLNRGTATTPLLSQCTHSSCTLTCTRTRTRTCKLTRTRTRNCTHSHTRHWPYYITPYVQRNQIRVFLRVARAHPTGRSKSGHSLRVYYNAQSSALSEPAIRCYLDNKYISATVILIVSAYLQQ